MKENRRNFKHSLLASVKLIGMPRSQSLVVHLARARDYFFSALSDKNSDVTVQIFAHKTNV